MTSRYQWLNKTYLLFTQVICPVGSVGGSVYHGHSGISAAQRPIFTCASKIMEVKLVLAQMPINFALFFFPQ